MADIREVARLAGVSISTVSRVMNHSQSVSENLRDRVNDAIMELDYSPNNIARGLKGTSTNTIAVIITSVSRPFFTPIIDGISQEARKKGYIVQIMQTNDSLEEEIRLIDLAVSQWVDGIILASSAYGEAKTAKAHIARLSTLKKRNQPIPVVSLEYALENDQVDAVIVDHQAAAYQAVSYLIQAVGRHKVAHISLPNGHYMGELRKKGYLQALKEHQLPFVPELLIEGDYTLEGGRRAVTRLIENHVEFDSIFCANDQMALGALYACLEAGLKVPEQVAVMGYDDISMASLARPTLTSVAIPKFEMGSIAFRQIVKKLQSHTEKQEIIVLDVSVAVRDSTGHIPERSSEMADPKK